MNARKLAYRLGYAAEAGCTFLDNHTPAWVWLTGWFRCPNGWLARLAFRLYEWRDDCEEPGCWDGKAEDSEFCADHRPVEPKIHATDRPSSVRGGVIRRRS